MAKVKSVKFYNFTGNLSSSATPGVAFIVKFYDIENKLIKIDFKNLITNTTTYCEDPEYIVTASRSYDTTLQAAFKSYLFTNADKNIENTTYEFWISGPDRNITSDWNKIEFKYPTYISKIKILHTIHSKRGFTSCDVEVEYEDGFIEVYNYVSNGQNLPYTATQVENLS